jgi:excisionase family DNA binding protein
VSIPLRIVLVSAGNPDCTDKQPNPGEPAGDLYFELSPALIETLTLRVSEFLAQSQDPQDPYMTVPEAADCLRCKPKRIYDLTSQGRLPYLKEGSRKLIRRSDLDVLLERHG